MKSHLTVRVGGRKLRLARYEVPLAGLSFEVRRRILAQIARRQQVSRGSHGHSR